MTGQAFGEANNRGLETIPFQNKYEAEIHKHSILGKAYVCEQSSVGITKNPTKLMLTVHPVSV